MAIHLVLFMVDLSFNWTTFKYLNRQNSVEDAKEHFLVYVHTLQEVDGSLGFGHVVIDELDEA